MMHRNAPSASKQEPMTVDEFVADMQARATIFGNGLDGALEECADIVHRGIQSNFDTFQSSEGQGWEPRKDPKSAATAGMKTKTHPLLHETGALEGAATGKGSGSIMRIVDGNTLEIGVDTSVDEGGISAGGVHQEGSPAQNIVARPFVGISDQVADECTEILADALLAQLV